MKLLQRKGEKPDRQDHADDSVRPPADEAPEPQPEHDEPRPEDTGPTKLSKRDYVGVLRRAFKRFKADHMTNIAAALAYYAFLAIPSSLLIAAGLFGLLAGPNAVADVIDKLNGILPAQAITLLEGSLKNLTQQNGTSIAVLSIGGVLAVWSLTSAMQNVMWALNIAYERDESRGFVRRRILALAMLVFALIGFALAFGILVLGPHLSTWIGKAIGAETPTKIAWYIAEWPLLIAGLLLVFAGLRYLGPNVEHPRWHFLSFGAVVSLSIWLLASGAFAFYASRFSSYNKTWGSLAAVVVMLTWLWLSSSALLFGAEIDAEAERSSSPPAKA
jgi:membrane protein